MLNIFIYQMAYIRIYMHRKQSEILSPVHSFELQNGLPRVASQPPDTDPPLPPGARKDGNGRRWDGRGEKEELEREVGGKLVKR